MEVGHENDEVIMGCGKVVLLVIFFFVVFDRNFSFIIFSSVHTLKFFGDISIYAFTSNSKKLESQETLLGVEGCFHFLPHN